MLQYFNPIIGLILTSYPNSPVVVNDDFNPIIGLILTCSASSSLLVL